MPSGRQSSRAPDTQLRRSTQRTSDMNQAARQAVFGAMLGLATLTGTLAGAAHSYPTRAITVIIPFAGGSASDVVSRIMLDRMSKSMGQPFIVDNKPGAGGNIGTAQATKAAPDGYTLLAVGTGPITANKTLYKELGYDPDK